ncbi:MAG: coproporphyrinogen dehydrogenase HemZ [Ruminiclostridium sp.]|nr:coproporphyrinogen dehydrogenase HemZ [Ruminiclostridium sp.]
MIFIKLDQEYRVEAFELIKLFVQENEFCFSDDSTGSNLTDPVLSCCVNKELQNYIVTVSFDVNQRSLYNKTMSTGANGQQPKKFKMLLKVLIYEALSIYTGKNLPWGILTGIRPAKIVHSLMDKGISVDEISNKLREYYKLSDKKAALVIDVAKNNRSFLKKGKNLISVYIGIPFCISRCLYCSFSSFSLERYGYLVPDYLSALKKETEWIAQWVKNQGIQIDTVYVGGGTPTALSDDDFNRLLNDIVPCLAPDNLREYTVEAGRPDTINREKLRIMKNTGVGRISINPQTMKYETLRLIGRNHTPEQIVQAFYMAREENFQNINMDLIAGLPGESPLDFSNTMEKVRMLDPESITVHTMAIKRASRLNENKQGFSKTGDEEISEMIETAMSVTHDMKMKPYYLYRQKNILANLENVGYAKTGYEGIYNILMMEEAQSIIALGVGGVTKILHSDNNIERIFNVKNVELYIHRIDEMIKRKEKVVWDVGTPKDMST